MLAQVLADPANEELRLVYADWLLGRGDPRGELIAIEARLARDDSPELRAARRALRRAYDATWWPEVAPNHVRTRCGFAEGLAVQPHQLAELGGLFAREPISELVVYGAPLEVGDVAQLPRVRQLTARLADGDAWAALLDAPVATTLTALAVPSCEVIGDLRDRLPLCSRLALPRVGNIPAWSLAILAAWSHLDRLRDLDLSNVDCDGHELAPVLSRARELVTLRASGNPYASRAIAAALPRLDRLERLEVIDGDRDDVAAMRAMRPDVAIVDGIESRVRALDLVGSVLELRPNRDTWELWLDGPRRRARSLVRTGTSPKLVSDDPGSEGDEAQLAELIEAIAFGWSYELSDTGAQLEAWLRPETRHVEITVAIGDVDDDQDPIDVTIGMSTSPRDLRVDEVVKVAPPTTESSYSKVRTSSSCRRTAAAMPATSRENFRV